MSSPLVVVVGAGPAGLAAAHALLDGGLPPSNLLVLERRPEIASRWNTIQIAGLALSRFNSWKAPDGKSVYDSMIEDGVIGESVALYSHMEHRLGKPRSERGESEDVANPCQRIVQISVEADPGKFDSKKFASKPNQSYETVRRSMMDCWRSAYIRDIEDHLMRILVAKGVEVAFSCDTKLVWNEESQTYSARVTRKEAKIPQDISRLPLGVETELKPTLVVVAEGGSRYMMKSQGVLARHGVEIKLKSRPKYFAAALVKHPNPSKLIPTSQVVGGTFYFDSPDHYLKHTAIVSGNVILRSPKYSVMEERGEEVPPDTWYLRVPNDDLSLERLGSNINGQDFGIVESHTSPAMRDWVTSHLTRIMKEFCPPDQVDKVEFTRIAAPFTQCDTQLDKAALGRNLVIFGDSVRTGHFASGMGINTIVAIDTYFITDLWKSLSAGVESTKALGKYNENALRSARNWHRSARLLHHEAWPAWVPDLDKTVRTKKGESAPPPKTVMKFSSPGAMEKWLIANFLLGYAVPVPFIRKGIRNAGEKIFGGVERKDYVQASL